MSRDGPKTVLRPAGSRPDLAGLARPLLELAAEVERAPRPDAAELVRELRARIVGFETAAQRTGGLRAEAILDARDALAALVDARARGNPALETRSWSRDVRRVLPRLASGSEVRAAAGRAEARNERALARFLGHCAEAIEAAAARPAPARRRRWGALLAVAGFAAVVLGWAGWAEWQYRARLLARLPDLAAAVAAGEAAPMPGRAAELDAFAAAAAAVERAAAASPLGLAARLPWLDPAAAARARYAELAAALVPGPLAEALSAALATEGAAAKLYDTLRATAILEGRAPWQPRFLAGWIAARPDELGALGRLAPHVAAIAAAPPGIAVPDLEIRAEAARFAAESDPAERAYLELARAEATGAVPDWSLATAAPGAAAVLVRRSGAPLEAGVPGLYTAAGWDHARDGGAAAAIARASAEGAALLGAGPAASVEAVLDLLQVDTLAAWRDHVGDLRVRPFADQPTAAMITGTLGVRDTPLAPLIREVWRQAGGEDRRRSHANQLKVAAEFGAAIQFVEQGRMREIARLFAALNVALQVLDADANLAGAQLMDVRERAASIAALSQAPLLVAQIIEDVLAQTAASHAGLLGSGAPRLWQTQVGPACAAAIDGRFPFGSGADADLTEVAEVLGPDGLVPRFFAAELAGLMEMEGTPWRWNPEARLSGFDPESAAFFERVAGFGVALAADRLGQTVTLTALAQRGAPTVAIGGVAAPVVTSGAPAVLAWPGPDPARGFEIVFDTGARAAAPGPWGLLRVLDGLRLRPRAEGRRYLVDLRLQDARAYVQLDFASAANPVALRPLLRGLSCPREI